MDRFWDKVDKSGDCWEWLAYKCRHGYGRIMVDGKLVGAHRLVMELDGVDIPSGVCVMHKCDNPGCVNPGHLQLGTHQENMADRDRKGRGYEPHGSMLPWAKLTEQDIPRIRDMLRCGATQRDVADYFGVTQTTISKINLGKIWGHA